MGVPAGQIAIDGDTKIEMKNVGSSALRILSHRLGTCHLTPVTASSSQLEEKEDPLPTCLVSPPAANTQISSPEAGAGITRRTVENVQQRAPQTHRAGVSCSHGRPGRRGGGGRGRFCALASSRYPARSSAEGPLDSGQGLSDSRR